MPAASVRVPVTIVIPSYNDARFLPGGVGTLEFPGDRYGHL